MKKKMKKKSFKLHPKDGDVTDVTFVDDFLVEVAVAEARPLSDEYETDSENDFTDREDEDIAPITVSRSGWPIRAIHSISAWNLNYKVHVRPDVRLQSDIFQKLIEK